MSTQAKKESWVERVLSFLNVTEEAKVSSMKKRMERYYKDEERKCNAQIEKLKRDLEDYLEISKEKLEEIKEQEEQAFIEINVDKIATVELRESYVFQLDEQFNKGIKARRQKEEEIQDQKDYTEKQIKLYKEKLEMIAYKKQQLL